MNDNAENQPKTPASAGILMAADEEKQEVNIGLDIDGDGKADIEQSFKISDPRIWAAIGWVVAAISLAKNLNLW